MVISPHGGPRCWISASIHDPSKGANVKAAGQKNFLEVRRNWKLSGKQGRKPTGRVNYIWVLAGGYLFYLSYQLFSGLWKGDAENPVLNVAGGVVFAVAAALMLLREWRAYRYGQEHIDDPESWSDEPVEEADQAAPALEEAPDGDAGKEEPR